MAQVLVVADDLTGANAAAAGFARAGLRAATAQTVQRADIIAEMGSRFDVVVANADCLHAAPEFCEPRADGVGNGAADAGVDLVEDKRGRRAAVGQHHFQRQQKTSQVAPRGHPHQRTRPRARTHPSRYTQAYPFKAFGRVAQRESTTLTS